MFEFRGIAGTEAPYAIRSSAFETSIRGGVISQESTATFIRRIIDPSRRVREREQFEDPKTSLEPPYRKKNKHLSHAMHQP